MNQLKKTEIILEVELDENHIPETMRWSAPDGGIQKNETKAALMGFWDEDNQEAMRIDLWVKEMPLDEMKKFFHQTFASLASTYLRASSEDETAALIGEFAETFARKSGIKE